MSFGSAIAEGAARQAVRVVLLFAVLFGVMGMVCGVTISKYVYRHQPQTFDAWFAEHQKTCPECGGPPDHPMCVEAFKRMQEELRK